MRTCTTDGCARKHYALGMCQPHYGKAWRDDHRPGSVGRWKNPLVCVCPEPQADLRVNFGECAVCRRKPLALMGRSGDAEASRPAA